MERVKKKSTAADNYLNYTIEVIKENEKSLHRNTEEIYGEVVDW